MSYSPLEDQDHERTALKSFDSDRPELEVPDFDPDSEPSREHRKRQWWRNAVINSLFIATWYPFIHLTNPHLLNIA